MIPVKISFDGSGTLTVDESYTYPESACIINTHDTMTLNWRSTFKGVVSNGGLSVDGLGLLERGPGNFSLDTKIVQGDASLKVPCESEQVPNCTGPLPSGPQPSFDISGGGDHPGDLTAPISFEAQSATQSPVSTNCSGPVAVEAKNDIQVLESALPGAMTGRAELPANALLSGTASVPVSYSNAPDQVPASCPSGEQINSYIPNTSCSASMSWSGTVTFEAICGAAVESTDCVKKQVKEWAALLAQEYRQSAEKQLNPPWWKLLFGENQRTSRAVLKKHMFATIFFQLAIGEEEIAKDPPDQHYEQVAKPKPPRVAGLTALRGRAPATYRLLRKYLQAAGIFQAISTTQNRASGAYLALAQGAPGAADALAKQDAAELLYAKQGAALLRGQRRWALAAAAELRRIAAAAGKGRAHEAGALRRLASSLVSKPARRRDALAAATLAAIEG